MTVPVNLFNRFISYPVITACIVHKVFIQDWAAIATVVIAAIGSKDRSDISRPAKIKID